MTEPDPKRTAAHPWPDTHRELTEEEARDKILFAEHADDPSFKVDGALLGLLEKGIVVFAMGPGNKLNMQATKFALEEDDGRTGDAES